MACACGPEQKKLQEDVQNNTFDLNKGIFTELKVLACRTAEIYADDWILVAGRALAFVNVEAVSENRHF